MLMEMTLRHLTSDHGIDTADFLQRTETLRALGKTVLISNFRRFHRLASYLWAIYKPAAGYCPGRVESEGNLRREFL